MWPKVGVGEAVIGNSDFLKKIDEKNIHINKLIRDIRVIMIANEVFFPMVHCNLVLKKTSKVKCRL